MLQSLASLASVSPAPRAPLADFWAPSPRWVACSARLAALGGRRAFLGGVVRASSSSGTGCVFVAVFSSARLAGAFARAWSGRLGLSVAVRRAAGAFAVSVPVEAPPPASPLVLAWRGPGGGPARFWRALGAAGF